MSAFQRLEQFWSAMNAGDLSLALELYSLDAEILLPGADSIAGAVAIGLWWEQTLEEVSFNISPHRLVETDMGGATFLRGMVKGAMIPRNRNAVVPVNSWFMQIYRRDEVGELRFWRGASGANPP